MGFLNMLGFKSPEPTTDWETKFKTAIKDLAARDDELDAAERRIEGLLRDASARAKWNKDITDRLAKAEAEVTSLKECAAIDTGLYESDQRIISRLENEIAALKPDAEAMRKKRQADIIRRQKNRDDAKAGKVRAAFVAKKVVGK